MTDLDRHGTYNSKAHAVYTRSFARLSGGRTYQLGGVGGLKVVLAAWPKAATAGLGPHQLLTQAVVEGHLLELQRRAVPQVVRLAQVLVIKHRQVPIEVLIKHRQVPRY